MATYESKKYDTPISDATKIADGSVNNTEFQYINSLSSNAQTQITARLPLAGGTMTGDIAHASNFTLDVGGDLILDADGGDILFKDAGTEIGRQSNSTSDFVIQSSVSDKDLIFKGVDGGSGITALTLDMSAAGAATFNSSITATTVTATTVTGDGSGLTALNGSNISSGTVADARISTLTASKLTGALPAIDGSNLTGIDVVPSGTDTVGAIRSFALYASNSSTPTTTTLSVGSEITPASYSSGNLYLTIDPPHNNGNGVLYGRGFQTQVSTVIQGKTRTTVSGTWRVLTSLYYTSGTTPGQGSFPWAVSGAGLFQRIS